MFKTAKYGSLAAVIAVAVALFSWLGPGAQDTFAFADVVKKLEEIKTARLTLTMKYGDNPAMTVTQSIRSDGMMRQDMPGGIVMIIDGPHQKALMLETQRKIARQINVEGLPGAGQGMINPIEQMRSMQEKDARPLGKEKLNGKEMLVYEVSNPQLRELKASFKLWIDPQTELPVQVVMKMMLPGAAGAAGAAGVAGKETESVITMDHFEWNPKLEEGLFSMEPPAEFKVIETRVNYEPKAAVMQSLKLYTKASDGAFPDAFDTAVLAEYMKLLEPKVGGNVTDEQQQGMMEVALGPQMALQLKTTGGEWHYAGKGLKVGKGGRVVAWLKVSGDKTYTVIFDDLSTKSVEEAELKAVIGDAAK